MPHPNRPTPSPLPALLALGAAMGILALTVLATPAEGQTVIRRVLFTNDGPIKAVSEPALHNGIFSGLGFQPGWAFVVYSGELGAATNATPHIIATEGDPVPNRVGSTFNHLSFPTVWNGNVYFSASGGPGTTTVPDGTYRGQYQGTGLSTLSDRINNLGPWIHRPFAGPLGVSFVNQGTSTGTGAGISLWTYDQQLVTLVSYDQPLADGTQVSLTSASRTAYADDIIAYTMRAGFPDLDDAGYGAFAYNTSTGQTTRVAAMDTPIPGDGRLMEFITSPDTDGSSVVFVSSHGHNYFGGTHAVCIAGIDGSNLRTIARTGQPMPGMPGHTYFSIGVAAIDEGVVWFQASYRDTTTERLNLFAHDLATGVTLPVILYTDSINGVTGNTPWFLPNGVDGRHAVIQLEAPTGTMGVSINTLVHAQITLPCAADLDNGSGAGTRDGAITIDDLLFFLNAFESGAMSADLDNGTSTGTPDGGVTIDDLLYFLARFESGC